MKRLKFLSIILFLLTVAGFSVYQVKQMKNVDKLGPLISINDKTLKVSVKDGEEKLLQGVTAADTKDGDVTASVVVESLSKFLDTGRRLVTYAAFDSHNHVSKAAREIVYTDYAPPRFHLEEPFRFPAGTTDVTQYLTAADCLDGDLTNKIKISPDLTITVDQPGEYKMKFQVANSAGDVVYLPATVEIYDSANYNEAPRITLRDYVVYTEQGVRLDPVKYLKSIFIRGQKYKLTKGKETYDPEHQNTDKITKFTVSYDRVSIQDNVDYEKPGTYEILYGMTGESGTKGKVRLIVVVNGNETEKGAE